MTTVAHLYQQVLFFIEENVNTPFETLRVLLPFNIPVIE